MFEDEKIDFIESLPECDAILVIWIKLLAQAGKNNMNGFIFLTEDIPYTDEMLAHKFRRPLNVVKLALQTLKQLEMISYNEEGYLKISNWEKHQNVEGLDKIREDTRKRVARHRAKQKALKLGNVTCNVTVTEGNDTEEEVEEEVEEEKNSSNGDYSKIVQAFQNNGFGLINQGTKDILVDLIETYSSQWVLEALEISVMANVRKLNYAEGILRKWKAEGKDNNGKHKSDAPGSNKESEEVDWAEQAGIQSF